MYRLTLVQEKLLEVLQSKPNHFFSIAEIANELGIKTFAFSTHYRNALKQLVDYGYVETQEIGGIVLKSYKYRATKTAQEKKISLKETVNLYSR